MAIIINTEKIKNPKIIAAALAALTVGVGGAYFILSGGPPLSLSAITAQNSVLPTYTPPPADPALQPVLVAPVAQPADAATAPTQPGADPVNPLAPPAPGAVAPVAVTNPATPMAPVAAPVVVAPVAAAPVAAVPAAAEPVKAQPVAPAAAEIKPVPAAVAPVSQVAKAPELGARPAAVPANGPTNAELMAKLDAISRDLRETKAALAAMQEKAREVRKPAVAEKPRAAAKKLVSEEVVDHGAAKAATVQEIRPGSRLANGETVVKITGEGAVTNTGRVIQWGEQ